MVSFPTTSLSPTVYYGNAVVEAPVVNDSQSNTVTVDYATSDGTAVGNTDYTPTSGTLTFSPGETLQSIEVPILGPIGDANNTFAITLSNPTGAALGFPATQTITFTVANPVTLNNPGNQTNYGGDSVNLPLSATDALGNGLIYSAAGLPPGLNLTYNSSSGAYAIAGTIATTADTNTPYSVTVIAIDQAAQASASQTFSWAITNPVSLTSPGNQSSYDGDAVNLPISAADAQNNPLSYSATGLPPGLALTSSGGVYAITGNISSTADTGSPYSVTITATDTVNGAAASQTVCWAVTNPVTLANPGNQTNYDGDTVDIPLSATDAESNALTYSAAGLPPGLALTSSSGVYAITGNISSTADTASPYSVTITATDSVNGAAASQTVSWTVNDPVSLTNPGNQTNYDGDTVDIPLSATDAESNGLIYSATGLPPGASLTYTSNGGVYSITGNISTTADVGSPYDVTITATDSANGASASQTFSWGIGEPVSLTNPGNQRNYDGASLDLPLYASDALGESLTYTESNLPPGLAITTTSSGGVYLTGTISTSADQGSPYTVVITATDSPNGASSSAAFLWGVAPDPVSLANPGTQNNDDGDAVDVTISGSDSLGNALTYTDVVGGVHTLPAGLVINPNTGEITGNISASADTSSPYTAVITATDSTANASASIDITWNVFTDPTANNATLTVEEGQVIPSINLNQYISGGDQSDMGTSVVSGPTYGTLTYTGYGTYVYTAPADWTGTDSITMQGSDGNEESNVATVTVDVTQYAPVNPDGSYTAYYEQTLPNINFANNDPDADGDPTQINVVNDPGHGTLTQNADGTYNYTPDAGFYGADQVTISANSGADVQVPINVVDQAPVLSAASFSTLHDQTLTASSGASGLLGSAYDPLGNSLTVTEINGAPLASGQALTLPSGATLTVNSDGSFTYVPLAGGVYNDGFTFAVSDGAMSATGTASIAVTDTAPVAQNETCYIQAGQVLSLDSTDGLMHDAYDADGDSITVLQVGSGPADGTLVLNADGSLTYTPNQGFAGTDTFSYELFDGVEYSSPASVTIQVQDEAPVASSSTFNVWTAQGVTAGMYNVLAGAVSANNTALTAVLYSGPQNAASFNLNSDGTFTYTPISGFTGTDSFQIMANDGTLNSAPVTVTLNVTGTPMANDDSYIVPASGQLTVSAADGVLANDFDPMEEIVGAQLVQGICSDIGTLNFNQDGSFTFTAGANFQGQASFTYQDLIQIGNIVLPGTTATVRLIATSFIASSTYLASVGFNGNATILQDDGQLFTPGPQYQLPNVFGDGGVNAPVSFTMGTSILVQPSFTIDPTLALALAALGNNANSNLLVRAQSAPTADGLTFQLGYAQDGFTQNVPLVLNTMGQLTTQGFAQLRGALPNHADYFSDLVLNWQISIDAGQTWITPVGTLRPGGPETTPQSSDPVYVTLANPNGWISGTGVAMPQIPVSDFFIGTENTWMLQGCIVDNGSLVSSVWSGFQQNNITNAAGSPLYYFGGWIGAVPGPGGSPVRLTTANLLLANQNGLSSAWAQLFVDVLRAWGDTDAASSNLKTITPTVAGGGGMAYPVRMLIGAWSIQACPNVPSTLQPFRHGFVYYNLMSQATLLQTFQTRQFVWAGNPPAVGSPQVPVPGQNNANPYSILEELGVVSLGGMLYLPSYGLAFASLQALANSMIGGFARDWAGVQVEFGENPYGGAYNRDGHVMLELFREVNLNQLGIAMN